MRSIPTMLAYEAKKKPLIGVVYDKGPEATDEEIDALKCLPWIKKALKSRRSEALRLSWDDIKPFVKFSLTPDPEGFSARWFGPQFVKKTRGEVEIPSGKIVFFPSSGGMWFDHLFFGWVNPGSFNVEKLEDTTLLLYRVRPQGL